MLNRPLRSLPMVSALLLSTALGVAGDWPQWRGARQDGSAHVEGLGGAESLALELAWRRPLGSGYSSISIVGDLGVTMAATENRDWVLAFDTRSGAERWRHELGESFLGRSGSDDGPMSTPAISADRVYVLTPDGRFLALESASGSLVWQYDLARDFGSESDYYGYSTAPMVHGERIYLLAGGSEGRMLVAFDRSSGKVVWKTGSDQVQHQSLVVTELGGLEQVVAPGRGSVAGFATDDGRQLWRHDFEEGTEAGAVLPIDDRRVLVTRWASAHLLEVVPGEASQTVREAWQADSLSSTYAVPVVHGEHLYGFYRRFLTCVELETGEVVWRSRPPGGQGLIGIDDHLLVMADDGELVTVAASPDGYRETGRLGLFPRRRVLTPPSLAGDRVFLRDLGELVAVDVRPSSAEMALGAPPPGVSGESALTGLLGRMQEGPDSERQAALVAMVERYPSMPVLEGGEIHFLYRGDEPDLAIVGDMTGAHQELPLRRVGNTDWHHRSFPAPERGRWEYQFKVFDEARLDPLNSSVVETPGGQRSAVGFGDDDGGEPAPECAGCERGTVVSHEIQSTVPERSYNLSVYMPPGYETADGYRYPVVFWAEGAAAHEYGDVVAWLDGLIGSWEIEPVVGVFLELPDAVWWEQSRSRFEEVMDQDVMPFLESSYRLSASTTDRAAIMNGWSATNMLLWSLDRGIGNVAVQSPFFGEYFLARDLSSHLAAAGETRLYVDWGSFDQENPDWGLNVAAQSRELADRFEAAGSAVVVTETPGGANWTRWSAETGRILRLFLPST